MHLGRLGADVAHQHDDQVGHAVAVVVRHVEVVLAALVGSSGVAVWSKPFPESGGAVEDVDLGRLRPRRVHLDGMEVTCAVMVDARPRRARARPRWSVSTRVRWPSTGTAMAASPRLTSRRPPRRRAGSPPWSDPPPRARYCWRLLAPPVVPHSDASPHPRGPRWSPRWWWKVVAPLVAPVVAPVVGVGVPNVVVGVLDAVLLVVSSARGAPRRWRSRLRKQQRQRWRRRRGYQAGGLHGSNLEPRIPSRPLTGTYGGGGGKGAPGRLDAGFEAPALPAEWTARPNNRTGAPLRHAAQPAHLAENLPDRSRRARRHKRCSRARQRRRSGASAKDKTMKAR